MRCSLLLLVVAGAATLASCDDVPPPPTPTPDDDDDDDDTPPPERIATRLVVSPSGALLTPSAPSVPLVATVLDQHGDPMDAEVTWHSSAPDVITVSAGGALSALAATGSAVVTASVGEVSSAIVAVAAEPAAGTVVVSDGDIMGELTPKDAAAPFGVGFRYDVTLANVPPPTVGAFLMTSGEKPVSGRVVEVSGERVTLEVVPLDVLFPTFALAMTLDLAAMPVVIPAEVAAAFEVERRADGSYRLVQRDQSSAYATAEFRAGPFECEIEGSPIEISLLSTTMSFDPGLSYEIVWDSDRKKVVIVGDPTVEVEVSPTASVSLAAELTCTATLIEIQLPFPGPIGLAVGAVIPFGVGFSLGGAIPIGGVGAELTSTIGASARFGFDCNPGCESIAEITGHADGTITPVYPADLAGVTVEADLGVFLFANLEGGARFTEVLRVEAIESTSGLAMSSVIASESTQAGDDDLALSYELGFAASVGAGDDFERFLDLVSVEVASLELELALPLARSPVAQHVKANRETFEVGDPVEFTVKLDPASVDFPVLGYNVRRVSIYRRTPDSLVLAAEATASEGQTEFTLSWIATVAGDVEHNFVAFLHHGLFDEPRIDLGDAVPDVPREGSLHCTKTMRREYDFDSPGYHESYTSNEVWTLSFAVRKLGVDDLGHFDIEVLGGSASMEGSYEEVVVNESILVVSCYADETVRDENTSSGSSGGGGFVSLWVQDDGSFHIAAEPANGVTVTTIGTVRTTYDAVTEGQTCGEPTSEPYQRTEEVEAGAGVDGLGAPDEEHEFAASSISSVVNGTDEVSCRLTL